QLARKSEVSVGSSRLKQAVVKVLKDEGYVADFRIASDGGKNTLTIALKYYEGRPVIDRLERVSRPGLRIYRGKDELPKVLGGMGTVIVSTPKGVMTDKQARAIGQGGEVLCIVA
ncbi:MAG: 30S ribosomal protein S8, partial [Gammaproteobacteria bacterium]|nr:30S ribosomal protein S8 [Gammaproteobacteria bacterium]